jgi:hypothetical protein
MIWLMLFKKIIAVYSENYTRPTNTLCGQNLDLLDVKAVGTYSLNWFQMVFLVQKKNRAI